MNLVIVRDYPLIHVVYNADVYERLVQNGKKAGFFQLLATQTVSAVWHVSSLFFIYSFFPGSSLRVLSNS